MNNFQNNNLEAMNPYFMKNEAQFSSYYQIQQNNNLISNVNNANDLNNLNKLNVDAQNNISNKPQNNKYTNSDQNLNLENINETDIIFNHVFINRDGQKFIPNTNNEIYFDQNINDFVLPDQVIKEDNITKMLRIKAILDSMNFDDQYALHNFKIADPPIIKGIEKIIPDLNKKENFSNEKIDTKIIKHDYENTYFLQSHDMNKKIIEPPNFMV